MTAEQFIGLLDALRVELGVDSIGLTIRAPQGVLSPRLRGLLDERHTEVFDVALDRARARWAALGPTQPVEYSSGRPHAHTSRCPRCHGLSSRLLNEPCGVCVLSGGRAQQGAA